MRLGPPIVRVTVEKALTAEERLVRETVERLTLKARRSLTSAVERAQRANPVGQLEAAYSLKGTDLADDVDLGPYDKDVQRMIEVAGREGYEGAARKVGQQLGAELTVRGPVAEAAEAYIREAAGALVSRVGVNSRMALREVLLGAFEEGVHPREAARRLRASIGMNRQQARAVESFRRSLNVQGIPRRIVDRRVNQMIRRKIAARAETIARNEIHTAVSTARQQTWRAAVNEGVLDPRRAVREWLTAEDERVCPICAPMNGQKRMMGEPFRTGDGREVEQPGSGVHVICRCAVALKVLARPRERGYAA